MGKLFGTDGVRGVANRYPMTAEVALQIGRATAFVLRRSRDPNHSPKVIIGKDTRLSCYMIENALVAGICSMGVDALVVGPMPTPGIAYLASDMRVDAGIVISASHNPFEDNGIKIFSSEGYKIPDNVEATIEDIVFSNKLDSQLPPPSGLGKAFRIDDALGRYIVFLKHTFPKEYTLEGMRVVVDCSNGATYKAAPTLLRELGAELFAIGDEPDGLNINCGCGSLYPEGLVKEVKSRGAHIGLAFDGDGDRLICVDEKGNVVDGDEILAICARRMKNENKLKKNTVVSTVMSNFGFRKTMEDLDIRNVVVDVGDRYVLERLKAEGAVLGGESSGHIIFLDMHTTGDGMLTALQVLSVMKKENKPLSILSKVMKRYPQVLINVDVKSRPDLSKNRRISSLIKKVELELGEKGRILVRYSGTQSICRVMVEASTQDKARRFAKLVASQIDSELNR